MVYGVRTRNIPSAGITTRDTLALTDTEIKKAKGGDKPYKMADGGNLYLLVNPSGGRLWRWAYRFEGRQKLMTFGKYPDVSLARVRERHSKQRAILADGIDPMAQKKALKTAIRDASENSCLAVSAQWVEHW